jgi:Flp pilus assembly protein TadD
VSKKTRVKKGKPAAAPAVKTKAEQPPPPPLLPNWKPWHLLAVVVVVAALALGWLAWSCTRNPQINFLPHHASAPWIVFPTAMDARAHRVANLDTIFRRDFQLDQPAANARLEFRAAKRAEVKINDAAIEITSPDNWKKAASADVAAHLRAGPNHIEVRVFNDNAPAALSLKLAAGPIELQSDQSWEASCARSAWRRAVFAAATRLPGAGNPMSGSETVFRSLGKVWIKWLILAAISAALWFAGQRWLIRSNCFARGDLSQRHTIILLAVLATLWLALLVNNARLMPFLQGFDSKDHLAYIKYIQERHGIPLPNEGFEMFQPPLYYLLSALALSICGLSADAPAAIIVLRFLTMIFGIVQFVFVFLTARLLFPGRLALQLVALGFAAFLPMQFYMSHYVTNETFAAMLVTVSLYLGLRVLQSNKPTIRQLAGLGVCLGAAMLSKATGLLVVLPMWGALFVQLLLRRATAALWLRQLGTVAAAFILTCGWHYARIWSHFGKPLVGNWETASGFSWWQDPGFRTFGDYARFGRSLVNPIFSGFWSFGDGIYSTFWGDALAGGVANEAFRPPWNHGLMIAGYLLAIAPTLLMLIGAAVALRRFVRRPALEWLVLFGLTSAVILGVIAMTLKVASYAQVKAFYGLATLVPLCCFGAIGWELLTRNSRVLRAALTIFLLFMALNSFASYWAVPSARQHVYAGMRFGLDGNLDAALVEANRAVEADPANAIAQSVLASVLNDANRASEALSHAHRAIELRPNDSIARQQLAAVFDRQGQAELALTEARRALELGPENLPAYNLALVSLSKLGRRDELIRVARDGLAVSPYIFELHHTLGVALAQKEDFAGALSQFGYAVLLQPESQQARANFRLALRFVLRGADGAKRLQELAALAWDAPVLLNEEAWFFATNQDSALRNGAAAVRLAERARLTNPTDARTLVTLAAAYAESGRIPEAITLADNARQRARSTGDSETSQLSEKVLNALQAGRAYRE